MCVVYMSDEESNDYDKMASPQAIDRYESEFQKWSLPVDLKSWFFQIVNND